MQRIPHLRRRTARLVGGCAVVGVGVGMVLQARLGSDGYSTAIYGISVRAGLPYAPVNWTVALACVLVAWARRITPGPATMAHPVIVGIVVDLVLQLARPVSPGARIIVCLIGVLILSAGVATYLSASLGSGPLESLTFALRPLPFRVAYTIVQAVGTASGWLAGAPVGAGTLLVLFGVGPLVSAIRKRLPEHDGREDDCRS